MRNPSSSSATTLPEPSYRTPRTIATPAPNLPDNYTISHHAQMERQPSSSQQRSLSDRDSPSASAVEVDSYSRQEVRHVIVSSLIQILEQPLSMLRSGAISNKEMCAESQLIPGSSFGKHLRHVHDHYRILLDSLEGHSHASSSSSDTPMALDYDKRVRVLPLETSTQSALQEFQHTQQRIERLLGVESESWHTELDRPIRLLATTPAEVELGSTLGREMWFVCLHAIHHYALARVILVHELGLKIEDSFGVAPSTMVMRLWRQAAQEHSKL